MNSFRSILVLLLLSLITRLASAADTPVYTQVIDQYLAGDWDALESTLSQRPGEIAALPNDQAADIAYIKRALIECHPAWWAQTKPGKKVIIHPTVWTRTLNAIYDPAIKGNIELQSTNGQNTLSVNWTASDMENPAPAEHGFSKGDLASFGSWNILGCADVWLQIPNRTPGPQPAPYQRYQDFRGCVTAIYYGTPRARRWGCFLSLDAFGARYAAAPSFIPRKPVGAMLLAEIAKDPKRYPSLRVSTRNADENIEQRLAASLLNQFARPITFAEDKLLREAVRSFAVANAASAYTSGQVTLPNKLTMKFNPQLDAADTKKRNAWLHDQLIPPTTQAQTPATSP